LNEVRSFLSPHDTDAYECVVDISSENQRLIWIAIRSANVDDSGYSSSYCVNYND
jgi:hypothetical protein